MSYKVTVLSEILILSLCNHPNIIKLRYLSINNDSNIDLINDYYPIGDLQKLINSKTKWDEYNTPIQIMKELSLSINYLHTSDPPIIHRDIKPSNCLIDNKGSIILSDFG